MSGRAALHSRRTVLLGASAATTALAGPFAELQGAAATNAVSQTGSFSVADYGAVGDGSDETVKIQSAIDAAAAGGGGGTVYFPASPSGRPYVVSTLSMADRVGLVGEHSSVTIKKANGTGGPVITNGASRARGHSSYFRNLTIDGNYFADAGTARGRAVVNCPNGSDGIGQFPGSDYTGYWGDGIVVEGVRVLNCGRHGLNFGDRSGASPMFLLRLVDVRSTYNGGRGLMLSTVWDSWVEGGWIAENVAGNILVTNAVKTRFNDLQLEGNDSGLLTAGGQRPGVEVNDAMWLVFQSCSFTTHRGGVLVRGSISSLTISGCTFSGGNSDGDASTWNALTFEPNGSSQEAINVHDNVFSSDAAHGAIGYHVCFEDPTSSGGLRDVIVRQNIHQGVIGVCPTSGFVREPTTNVERFNAHAASGGTYLYADRCEVPSGMPTPIPFAGAVADYGGQHDSGQRPHLVIVARSGPYTVTASVGWPDVLGGDRSLEIRRSVEVRGDTDVVIAAAKGLSDSAGGSAHTATVALRLNAGDAIALVLYQSSPRSLTAVNCSLSVVPCV